jgi:hypothetical protein
MVFAVDVKWTLAFIVASAASATPKKWTSLKVPAVCVQFFL